MGVWVAILLAIVVVSLWDYDSFEMGAWVDDATYIGLARALWQPDSYAWLAANTDNAALTFPPGYSLVLAPLVALFPDGFLIPQLTSLLFTLLCATVLYWGWPWFAPGTSEKWAIAVTILYGVSSLTIEHTRMVMSEPLFTLLTLLALLVTERAARSRLRYRPSRASGCLARICAAGQVGGSHLDPGYLHLPDSSTGPACDCRRDCCVSQFGCHRGLDPLDYTGQVQRLWCRTGT